jgi:hypothetical protein
MKENNQTGWLIALFVVGAAWGIWDLFHHRFSQTHRVTLTTAPLPRTAITAWPVLGSTAHHLNSEIAF